MFQYEIGFWRKTEIRGTPNMGFVTICSKEGPKSILSYERMMTWREEILERKKKFRISM
jgi:hypothetical protein